jgi:hypothetical protein
VRRQSELPPPLASGLLYGPRTHNCCSATCMCLKSKGWSRLVAYLRIVSVWTVSRVIIPLQNVDTVIRIGLFAHLAVFSRRIKGTTRSAAAPVLTCTRCISAPHKAQLECTVITKCAFFVFSIWVYTRNGVE